MTANIVASLRQNPELAIFLTLALGFLLGRVRVGTFRLGNVVGTLLAGVLIGQLSIKVHPLVEVVFFDLFLFATGYKVGPQFFRGLKKNAMPQVLLTLVLCGTSLVVTVVKAPAIRPAAVPQSYPRTFAATTVTTRLVTHRTSVSNTCGIAFFLSPRKNCGPTL